MTLIPTQLFYVSQVGCDSFPAPKKCHTFEERCGSTPLAKKIRPEASWEDALTAHLEDHPRTWQDLEDGPSI